MMLKEINNPKNIKISAYIILYHDLGFLNNVIANIYEFVDEIILIDGPYIYNIDILKKLNLFYDIHSKPEELVKILIKYSSKIKYIYDIFNGQEEKRIRGYETCKNDLILSIDCDEFCKLNIDNIIQFFNSDKKVAGFWINNMNRVNVNIGTTIVKHILFKKKFISAYEHLAYTWTCWSEDNLPIFHYIYNDCYMGEIFHQTLNRNKFDSIIKYIYYISLYFYNFNNKQVMDIDSIPLISDFTIKELIEDVSVEELLDIFYHSKIELIGIPNNDNILYWNDNVSINLDKYNSNHASAFFKENTLAIRKVPYFCIVNIEKNNTSEIEFLFDNVTQMHITIYQINIGEPYEVFQDTFTFIEDDLKIKYPFIKKDNYFSTVIMFRCSYTIDNTKKYNIKNINFV